MRRTTRSVIASTLAALLVLLSAATASADNVIGDGDGAVPLSTSNLNFGSNVCVRSSTTKDVALGLERQTNDIKKIAKPGSTVTFSVSPSVGNGLTAAMGTPSSITVPADWATSNKGTTTLTAAFARVTLEASTLGPVSGTLTMTAAGVASDNSAFSDTATLPVPGPVVSCDSTAPTLSLPA